MRLHFRQKFGSTHLNVGLASVLRGRREQCKPSTGPGKKGCTTFHVDPFRPWRNGQKPPETMKLRLCQVVEQSKGWVFVERLISEMVLRL